MLKPSRPLWNDNNNNKKSDNNSNNNNNNKNNKNNNNDGDKKKSLRERLALKNIYAGRPLAYALTSMLVNSAQVTFALIIYLEVYPGEQTPRGLFQIVFSYCMPGVPELFEIIEEFVKQNPGPNFDSITTMLLSRGGTFVCAYLQYVVFFVGLFFNLLAWHFILGSSSPYNLPKGPRRMLLVAVPTEAFKFIEEINQFSDLSYGLLLIQALSSLTVYAIILSGWASNSKYAFIGSLRSAAQMISYEVVIALIILSVVLVSGSLNFTEIVVMQVLTGWNIWILLPAAAIFLVVMLAETNRTPFDLPEAEAELVAGYNVDYSSLPFAMFFLAEYSNMIAMAVTFCLLFLGGWEFFFDCATLAPHLLALKSAMLWVYYVIVRATLPRYRYDQLMDICWKSLLPLTGSFFCFVASLVFALNTVPYVHELPVELFFPEHSISALSDILLSTSNHLSIRLTDLLLGRNLAWSLHAV